MEESDEMRDVYEVEELVMIGGGARCIFKWVRDCINSVQT